MLFLTPNEIQLVNKLYEIEYIFVDFPEMLTGVRLYELNDRERKRYNKHFKYIYNQLRFYKYIKDNGYESLYNFTIKRFDKLFDGKIEKSNRLLAGAASGVC